MSQQGEYHADMMAEFLRGSGGAAVIDGGLATELEANGADLKDALWSARCLFTCPDLIRKVRLRLLLICPSPPLRSRLIHSYTCLLRLASCRVSCVFGSLDVQWGMQCRIYYIGLLGEMVFGPCWSFVSVWLELSRRSEKPRCCRDVECLIFAAEKESTVAFPAISDFSVDLLYFTVWLLCHMCSASLLGVRKSGSKNFSSMV
jgi:hypothetical protein